MLNVRLAGGHLYGIAVHLAVSGVLDEIWDLIESVSEGFPTYSFRLAALLFWFFGDFRCSVSLFIVILVIHKYEK